MRKIMAILVCVYICALLSGCGETLSGIGKDVNRMGKGISTFFFRQP